MGYNRIGSVAYTGKGESPLPGLENPLEKWMRKNFSRAILAPSDKRSLKELGEKLKVTGSEEEKTRLVKEYVDYWHAKAMVDHLITLLKGDQLPTNNGPSPLENRSKFDWGMRGGARIKNFGRR